MKHDISRRRFLQWTAAGAASLALPRAFAAGEKSGTGAAISTTFPESSAALRVADPSRIKLLQFTDLHFFCHTENPALDQRTIEELPKLVEMAQPDAVMVTGDFWHNNPDGRGQEYAEFAIDKIEKLGVPWLFTWGNHDMLSDVAKGHDTFHQAKNSLYRGGPGAGNYVVELRDKAGANVWNLVCLNSSSNGIEEAPRQWLKDLKAARKDAKQSPAFAIYHIPIKQQIEAWGQKKAAGVKLNGGGSAEKEDGSTLGLLKDLGVRAGFCGHIHTFDYTAQCEDVELVFGHATGWAGWGGDVVPKGAKLITLNAQSGTHTWESIFADGSRWQPTPGKQVDQLVDNPWKDKVEKKA